MGERVIEDPAWMPGRAGLSDARINFAESMLRRRGDAPAIIFNGEGRRHRTLTYPSDEGGDASDPRCPRSDHRMGQPKPGHALSRVHDGGNAQQFIADGGVNPPAARQHDGPFMSGNIALKTLPRTPSARPHSRGPFAPLRSPQRAEHLRCQPPRADSPRPITVSIPPSRCCRWSGFR
jgi:hypothetical protein